MDDFFKKAFVGYALFGDAITLQKPDITALFLTGHYDKEMRCALYFRNFGRAAENEEELHNPEIDMLLERARDMVRRPVQQLFSLAAEQDRLEAEKARMERMRALHQPDSHGTVDEIATKFGISKKEVRRRKAAGTLDELFAGEKA